MIVDFDYNIGEKVYFPYMMGMRRTFTVEIGEIQGLSIRKVKRKGIVHTVDFKIQNNIPVENISRDEEAVKKWVEERNLKEFNY